MGTCGRNCVTAAGVLPILGGLTKLRKLGKLADKLDDAHDAVNDLRKAGAGNNLVAPNAAQAATQAKEGTYVLRDPATGQVLRSGRTNDLARREAEHLRDPALKDYTFEAVNRTDVYAEQRGLEQMLHETYNPPLSKIGGIDPKNPRLPEYREAAQQYLQRQQEGQ